VYSTYYYENEVKEKEGPHRKNAKDSIWTYWDEKGRLSANVSYTRGNYHGELIRFYPNGKKGSTSVYKKDSLMTETARWDSLGNMIYQFKPGRNFVSGQITIYHRNGTPKLTFDVKKKLPHGKMFYAHENGNPAARGQLWKGYRIGKWKFYYPNGKLEKETTYLKSEKVKFVVSQNQN
jgi:antitoxin component YwqK of YwqJK toxin-antitoxin module